MSLLEQLRAEAAALEADAAKRGNSIQHCAALEQVAKQHGYESWRACRAMLSAGEVTAGTTPERLTRRYESKRWGFGVDIPLRWNAFPAVPTNSPFEVIRFASREHGNHLMIIFREPRDPEQSADQHLGQMQDRLQKGGFGNFAAGEAAIGASLIRTLDFNKPMDEDLWSVRHYVFAADTLRYILGFGTNRWDALLPTFERTAKSFSFEPVPWSQAD